MKPVWTFILLALVAGYWWLGAPAVSLLFLLPGAALTGALMDAGF